MAVTNRKNGVKHTAAGDETTGRYLISQIIWNGSSTAGSDLTIRNADSDLLLQVKSDGSQFQPIAYPFGRCYVVNGFETDVLDEGTVEYIFE